MFFLPLLLLGLGLLLSLSSDAASARGKHSKPRGTLVVKIAGLPSGSRSAVTVRGPKQHRGSRQAFKRTLSRTGSVAIERLRPGRYRINLSSTLLTKTTGGISAGARAYPVQSTYRASVKPRKTSRKTVSYGTIVNPGVVSVPEDEVLIVNNPLDPNLVVLSGVRNLSAGVILSISPGGKLPLGLLAKVVSSASDGANTAVVLSPANIYEVAPNLVLNSPVSVQPTSTSRSGVKCAAENGIEPYKRIVNPYVTGGWNTVKVFGREISIGVTVDLNFTAEVGANFTAAVGGSCSLSVPAVVFQGMAGPIPVYGSITGEVVAGLSAGARMNVGGSVKVKTGASSAGLPPNLFWIPHGSFSSPRFNADVETFATALASVGLKANIGIGAAVAANLHLSLNNSLDFGAKPGKCSWDLNLGSFSGGGTLLAWDISTPETPALYSKNLWSGCSGSYPPEPGPTPRAKLDWDTDSDIDLYIWDENGDQAYYADLEGIWGSQLINDVIPDDGEADHYAEEFYENEDPGRNYTYGVCVFNGDGGNVTLTVNDPGGGTRTIDRSLSGMGDNAVLTTSPEGQGFIPDWDWCQYSGWDSGEYEGRRGPATAGSHPKVPNLSSASFSPFEPATAGSPDSQDDLTMGPSITGQSWSPGARPAR